MGAVINKKKDTKVFYAIKLSTEMRESLKLIDENPPEFLTFEDDKLDDAIKMADKENSPVLRVDQEIISTYSVEYAPKK